MVYLAYIAKFSRNLEDNIDNVETVLTLLKTARPTIKLNKCFFINDSIEYPGHMAKPNKLQVTPKRIKAVKKL